MMRASSIFLVALLFVPGSARAGLFGPSRAELQGQVDELEHRLAVLEAQIAAANAPDPAEEAEAAAREIYSAAMEHVAEDRPTEALALLERLVADFGSTSTARRGQRTLSELKVVGTSCPEDWASHLTMWFQGDGSVDLMNGTTLVVFFEEWCPHCKREVPALESWVEELGPSGLQVVGLTRLTKSSTEERVRDFLVDAEVGYPIAKEDGELSEHFAVSGIPAAVVLRDGVAVWRGHPAKLDAETLSGWL